ncbi:DUF4365 domain-containing protein [Pedobacter sp. ASV1-7]|uniref:DUF4365 domain-containing protein n=1 Tax=Pedobacter sp. ASV1-7 TaxID=3145237 RepID=UPI0032E901A0
MKYSSEERIGVYSVAKIFTQNLKWIFREQPVNDFGIDAFVEITKVDLDLNTLSPSGRLIGVQIKCGESYFKESNGDHVVFRGSKKHLEYWLNHSMPVIVVIYNNRLDTACWQVVDETTVILTGKSFKLKIPKQNILNNTHRAELSNVTLFKNRYQYKLWQLQTSLEEVKLLLRQKQLFLYVKIEETSRFDDYHITLVVIDADSENYPELFYNWDFDDPNRFEYYFHLLNGKSLTEAIYDILPWAEVLTNGVTFTDEVLTVDIANDLLSFEQEEFIQDVTKLKRRKFFLDLACYLSGSYSFKLELKPNQLTHAIFEINAFLNKEPVVKTRIHW